MYKRYLDGKISEEDYKIYLHEQEERERKTSERFDRFVGKLSRKNMYKKCDNGYNK